MGRVGVRERDVGGGDGGLSGDALGGEVVGVLPGAGVAVMLGEAEADGDRDGVAAVEVCRDGAVGDDGDADAAGDGDHG